jgi:hypothetical protein
MYRSSDVLAHFKRVCEFLEIYCPCKVCKNDVMFKDREVICEHLVQSAFVDSYFFCTKHGVTQPRI